MKDTLSTKAICELIINKNMQYIKSNKIMYAGYILTIALFTYLYSSATITMELHSNMMLDYILNLFIMAISYLAITSIIMYIYINALTNFIYNNINSLLPGVQIEYLNDAYFDAIERNIKDDKLLNYLQKYSK